MIRDLLDSIPLNGWSLAFAIALVMLAGFFIGFACTGRRT